MDWHSWIKQQIPRTAIQRGGATVWPKGAHGLIGDTLGPIMHAHHQASEIFYFVSGRCRLEVGNGEELFEPGDFVLVPPLLPHNLWNAGNDDLLVFWLVAPNLIHDKWHTEGFTPAEMSLKVMRSHVAAGAVLPSDANIRSTLVTLSGKTEQSGARNSLAGQTRPEQEVVLYIVEGQANVRVGKLRGTLDAHDFIHVPVETAYSVAPVGGPALVMVFEMPG